MVNILDELGNSYAIILTMPKNKYNDTRTKITKDLSDKKICYITLKTTHEETKKHFSSKKVKTENITWIDCITGTFKDVPEHSLFDLKDCYYISPQNEMSAISNLMKRLLKNPFSHSEGCDYLVFDSLNDLFIYQSDAEIKRFMYKLIRKLRESSTKGVFLALVDKKLDKSINEISRNFDKIINV